MDCRTGQIHQMPSELAGKIMREEGRKLVPLSDEQVEKLTPMGANRRKNWMRNNPCPCDSGKKFKKCCWGKYA
jgi:uncharacterized protein YecA (UPF0149 family)